MYYVIPSLSRVNTLLNKSLYLLIHTYQVSPQDIYVFVVKEELADYQNKILSLYPDIHICVGPLGLHHMRNHIRLYFPENTKLVCLDDDIQELRVMKEDTSILDLKSCKRYPLFPLTKEAFHVFINDAFTTLEQNHLHFFGIYAVRNGYFMKSLPDISTHLRFCVGAFWGCINQHSESLQLHLEEKEDVERTLRYFLQDKGVLRFNKICPITRYYKEKGGMQARNIDRLETSKTACQYLLTTFPEHCKLYTSKKSGIYEIKLCSN